MIYNEQPEGFIPNMEVVGCVVESNNKILLLNRLIHKPQGGKWGLPAGKLDSVREDKTKAMARELKEETGLVIREEDLNFHKTFYVSHLGLNFFYHYFHIELQEIPDIKISKDEHKTFIWITPEDALNMTLVLDEDYCMKDYYGIK